MCCANQSTLTDERDFPDDAFYGFRGNAEDSFERFWRKAPNEAAITRVIYAVGGFFREGVGFEQGVCRESVFPDGLVFDALENMLCRLTGATFIEENRRLKRLVADQGAGYPDAEGRERTKVVTLALRRKAAECLKKNC